MLAVNPDFREIWNYGNVIHHANLVLGEIAHAKGNLVGAKFNLLEAGRTPGSAQLNSFGPNMTLANALLELGERDVVLEFFELCRGFWDFAPEKLDQWKNTVEAGGIPDFGGNLVYGR